MQSTFDVTAARELDARASHGVEVRLLWNPPTDGIAVEMIDGRSGEHFTFAVEPGDAMEAFRHPFAYAAAEPVTPPDSDLMPLTSDQGEGR